MKTLVRTGAALAVLLASAIAAGAVAAGEPASRLQELTGVGEAAERRAEGVDAGTAMPEAGRDRHAQSASASGAGNLPPSRLLRSLNERASQTALSSAPTTAQAAGFGPGTEGAAPSGEAGRAPAPGNSPAPGSSPVPGSSLVFRGCPRALLGALLASAAETDDAVAALAIERETLALCRERQEIVNGIVAFEGELGTLLAEVRDKAAAGPVVEAVSSTVADNPIVKASAPVRVVSLPPATSALGEEPKEAEAPEDPTPPSYFWFSIIGTAGDLRAGIGDGERGGTSVWFVREGDRLPGEVVITGIGTKPPGVRIGGTEEASLPYRPRSADASLAASGIVRLGGDAEGDGR